MAKRNRYRRHRKSNFSLWGLVLIIIIAIFLVFFLDGRVIKVHDGDTITVFYQLQPVRIRLWGIDAPELEQDDGTESASALRKLILGKKVLIEPKDKDRYGRLVAIIYVHDTLNVNRWLVREGWAWVYRRYNKEEGWLELEEQARDQKIGLWADEPNVPPWEWRRQNRKINRR